MRVPDNNFDVEEMFTEEDKAFNRKMVEQAKSYDDGKSQKSIQKIMIFLQRFCQTLVKNGD